MKKFKLFLLALLYLNVFVSPVNSQSLDIENTTYIDSLLNSNYPPNEPGVSVLIAKEGNVVYEKAFGKAEIESNATLIPDNVLAIGSMTKQITAGAVLLLVNEGKINLSEDIKKYLPDYNTHGKTITVENLLTHTSGIPSFTEKKDFGSLMATSMSHEGIVNTFQNDELLFEPGTNFSYSNSAYYLLGLIIEKVSGMTYQEFVQKNIFDKLKMSQSYFGTKENNPPMRAVGYEPKDSVTFKIATYFDWSWPFSAGNILSTTGDLLLWNEALYGDELIPQSLIQKAFTPFILKDGKNTNYGYGWNVTQLENYTVITHGGAISGYLSDAIRIPQEKLYIVALSNNGGKSPTGVIQNILLKLLNISEQKPKVISLDKNSLDQYVGTYEVTRDGGRVLTNYGDEKQYRYITREGDSLFLKRTGGGKLSFLPYDKDRFMTNNSNRRFDFIRDAGNNIIALEVYDYPINFGMNDYCNKVDVPLPTEKKEITLTSDVMKKYEGEYELQPGFNLKMYIEDGNLFVLPTGQSKAQLYPESETKFFLKIVDAQVEFVPDADGSVNKLIFTQGQTYECKRIK